MHTAGFTAGRVRLRCKARRDAPTYLPPASEACRRRISLAAGANPTSYMWVAAHAASAVARGRRKSRTASTATIIRVKPTTHGKQWRSSSRTPMKLHPACKRLNAMELTNGSIHRKSAGRALTAEPRFHGMRRYVTNAATDWSLRHMTYPAGGNSYAALQSLWHTGKEKLKIESFNQTLKPIAALAAALAINRVASAQQEDLLTRNKAADPSHARLIMIPEPK
jgi:hypothetical protein